MVSLSLKTQLALVVHDMQNDGLKRERDVAAASEMAYSNQEVIAYNVRLLEAARRHGLPVFFTGHSLRDDYWDAAHRTRSHILGIWKAGSWGAEVIDELKPAPGETIIHKGGGYSSFTGTPLEKWLRRGGVTTIIIAGVATHSGVEATVRAACDLDFDVIVVSDACNAKRANHEASLLNMAFYADIATTGEVIDALEKASG